MFVKNAKLYPGYIAYACVFMAKYYNSSCNKEFVFMTQGIETGMEQEPVIAVVTGGAGQIGSYLAPLVVGGETFGDRDVHLRLLEIPDALKKAEGVEAEVMDGAYPRLASIGIYADPREAFDGASDIFMVGSRPRSPGMERAQLLEANGAIFKEQGAALEVAADDVRVLVVGNPANSNALVASRHAPPELAENGQIAAMTRLDHNRAVGMAADWLRVSPADIDKATIFGNHSPSMVVDMTIAELISNGTSVQEALVEGGVDMDEFATRVAKRGAEILDLRGLSSAMSAARAASTHMRDWNSGLPEGQSWTSASVLSEGQYGLPKGVYASMPVSVEGGRFIVVEGLKHPVEDEKIVAGIQKTGKELEGERQDLDKLGLLGAS